MDKILFRETFSQLHASDEAKKEVFWMTENEHRSKKRLVGAARAVGFAAAAVMALVVTAGAINVATDGALLEGFTVLWTGREEVLIHNEAGDQVYIVSAEAGEDFVEELDGRLILHADRDIDITGALEEDGRYHYEYQVTVYSEDGSRDTETFTVDVTGTPASWTATQRNALGVAVTLTSEDGEISEGLTVGGENGMKSAGTVE